VQRRKLFALPLGLGFIGGSLATFVVLPPVWSFAAIGMSFLFVGMAFLIIFSFNLTKEESLRIHS
jgi:hypothetical protein